MNLKFQIIPLSFWWLVILWMGSSAKYGMVAQWISPLASSGLLDNFKPRVLKVNANSGSSSHQKVFALPTIGIPLSCKYLGGVTILVVSHLEGHFLGTVVTVLQPPRYILWGHMTSAMICNYNYINKTMSSLAWKVYWIQQGAVPAGLGHVSLGSLIKLTVFQLLQLSSGDPITCAYEKGMVHPMIFLRPFS